MHIYIVPLDFEDNTLLTELSDSLKEIYKIPNSTLPMDICIEEGWSWERKQLSSTWLLTQLLKMAPDNSSKILGVTTYDLFTPILTYLFGEAELGGRAAIFSIHRFQNELYGLQADREFVKKRMIKEAVHELGHTFGLVHCYNYRCVMHASSYIEEFDHKTNKFCDDCLSIMEEIKTDSNYLK